MPQTAVSASLKKCHTEEVLNFEFWEFSRAVILKLVNYKVAVGSSANHKVIFNWFLTKFTFRF